MRILQVVRRDLAGPAVGLMRVFQESALRSAIRGLRSCTLIRPLALALTVLAAGCAAPAQQPPASAQAGTSHYLFSYFTGNGEDGLHLAYSTDGLHWQALNGGKSLLTPQLHADRLMRDPSIVQGPDGTFHMVWTVSWNAKGIGHASSKDLIQWSEQQYIPVMAHEPGALNSWAPELFYDAENDQYLIFWATTIPGRFPETDGQDARPDAPGWNHRLYYVTTKDFDTFSDTQLFYEPGFNVIDAAVVEEGGRYVMFLKDETNLPFTPQKNIRVATSGTAEGPYSAPSAPITGDYWAEGPTALKAGGTWYVYFDKYRQHQYGAVASEDLETWRDVSDRLIVPEGMRHGTAFAVSEAVARKLLALD